MVRFRETMSERAVGCMLLDTALVEVRRTLFVQASRGGAAGLSDLPHLAGGNGKCVPVPTQTGGEGRAV